MDEASPKEGIATMIVRNGFFSALALALSCTVSVAQSNSVDSFIEQVRATCLEGSVEAFISGPADAVSLPNFGTFRMRPWSGGVAQFYAPDKFGDEIEWSLDVHLFATGRRSFCYGQIAQPMSVVSAAISSMEEAKAGSKLSSNYKAGNVLLLQMPNPVVTQKNGARHETYHNMTVILSETKTTYLTGPLTFMVGLHD
jgi:hypothetical protein